MWYISFEVIQGHGDDDDDDDCDDDCGDDDDDDDDYEDDDNDNNDDTNLFYIAYSKLSFIYTLTYMSLYHRGL